jgi:hypothetical protein
MKITIFVSPKSLAYFITITSILKGLRTDTIYKFNPLDLVFSEAMISDWIWVTMEIEEFIKLKYCMEKQK